MYFFDGVRRRGRRFVRWLFHPANTQQRNVRNVLIDGIGVGLVTGVATFLSVFLVRLGASPFIVSLLTSMPALTGMILAIPVGRLLERQRNIVPWYSRARVWVLGSYALTGLVPFVFSQNSASIAIIVIWAIATIPQTIVTVAFTVVMGAVTGPDQRYYLMSRRWTVLGVTTALAVALAGVALDAFVFPLNYQIVFIASFAGGLLSFLFSSRIAIPDNESRTSATREQRPWRARLCESIAAIRENAAYTRFVISAFVFNFGMTLALPLFPLYWARVLNASDFWIGLINTVNNAVLLVAYFIWAELSRRRGAMLVLRICALGLASYPLLTGLTGVVPPLLVYAGLAGIFGAGLNLVLFDILLSTVPKERTASYVAIYQLTVYVATFIAPIVGAAISDAFGYAPALFVAAGVRLAGFVLFTILGVGALAAPVSASVPQQRRRAE
jgi:MFS family permease